MDIKTKYNIGDEVWFRAWGEIVHCRIATIQVIVEDDIAQIWYYFGEGYYGQPEDLLFASEEELLKNE